VTENLLRTRVRDSGLRLIRRSGGLDLASRSAWRDRRLLILCYHGFSLDDEHVWNPQIYVSAAHLEARLRFLGDQGYNIIPLTEGLARMQDGSLPPRSVAITVDDGNYDFFAVAYPILARRRVPVTVFVSTYHVFDQRPVFDVACSYLMWHALTPEPVVLPNLGRGDIHGITVEAADYPEIVARIRQVSRDEHWTAQQKQEWLEQLAVSRHLDWEGFLQRRLLALMRPEELRRLDPAIADVQLHTHRHRVPEDREFFLREIRDNRRALADCGFDPAPLTQFCYPSGVHRRAFLPWLAEAGVLAAVTGSAGLASIHNHPLLLPRFMDTNRTSEVEFEGWVSGLRHFIRRPTRPFAIDP
jgi:peptidoglycan/xylan/chitin deacetylase (PgdA/CDA1 family)